MVQVIHDKVKIEAGWIGEHNTDTARTLIEQLNKAVLEAEKNERLSNETTLEGSRYQELKENYQVLKHAHNPLVNRVELLERYMRLHQ